MENSKKILSFEQFINKDVTSVNEARNDEERELILDELLNDVKSDHLKVVIIKFTTPLKEVRMSINLANETKYQNFLYT